jgi:protein subunit release factor A
MEVFMQIIEIRPGEGGQDAKLFMKELAETYCKYLDRKS